LQLLRDAWPGDFQASAVDANDGVAAIRVSINSVGALSQNSERPVRGVHLDRITTGQLVDADSQGALLQAELRDLIVQICHGQVCRAGQADCVRSDLQFGTCILVGVDAIASCYREIARRRAPLLQASSQKRNIAS
jgi:hypothetical protein